MILTAEELTRAEKFRKEDDRHRFILARIVLRKLLAEMLQCQPHEVPVILSKHKKPVIGSAERELHFSISHSGDHILIGISSKEVGVDIEYINSAYDPGNVMQYSFNEEEISFANDDPAKTSHRFYLLWTRKEALLKATGKGLTSKLPEITAIDGKRKVAHDVIESTGNYIVSSLSIDDSYIASICRAANNSDISFWKW